MKFKSTLILLGIAVVLLLVVLFLLPRKPAEESAGAQGPWVTDLKAEDVERIVIGGPETIGLRKDEKGDWLLETPLQAPADEFEVNRLAEDLSRLRAERVADEAPSDPSAYGIAGREVALWIKGRKEPIRIRVGDEHPVDGTLYARKDGEQRVLLLPASVKVHLEKTPFDLRKKDIFGFDTSKVDRISLRSRENAWEAARRDGEWFLETPVKSLADRYGLESVINSLSGLRAKEFVSEHKTDADLRACGLDEPDVEVGLSLPAEGREITFSLTRKDEKTFVATSSSEKIVSAESSVFTDLGRKPQELREKGVDVFNAWEVERLRVKSGKTELALSKDEEGRWRFDSGGEADGSKVESFLRRVDGLQAAEFIDRPGLAASYGLDNPRAEIVIGVKDFEGKAREVILLVGAVNEEKKQAVIKNPRLGYLLRVDSSFLDDIPASAEDWEKAENGGSADENEG
ncbi:MAG: DUF4340 domain-containing protein [Candidatus Aminicenantes bacterium]|nr:DUF4340 domain-containing protein [Candidatus Aminicenantes bacterium]